MNMRMKGLLKLLGGGSIFGLVALWVSHPAEYPFSSYPAGPSGALIIGLPGAVAIIGLIEFFTGKDFRQLEAAWHLLHLWKKVLLGSFIVIFGGAVAFTIVGLLVA